MYQVLAYTRGGYLTDARIVWSLKEAAVKARDWSRSPSLRACAVLAIGPNGNGHTYAGRYRHGRYYASNAPATY